MHRPLPASPALVAAETCPTAPARSKATLIVSVADLIQPHLARGQSVTAEILRSSMETAFGDTDAAGRWLWRDAYEACEVAQVLFLRRYGAAMRRQAKSPAATLAMLDRVAALLPTQTKRSEESQRFQQFSTPIGLGYVMAVAADTQDGDVVLEPSAGTGLLAIHAAGSATLALNELAPYRADLARRWDEWRPGADRRSAPHRGGSRTAMGTGDPVSFKPDWTRHAKAAPFKRNDELLKQLPIGVVIFPGSGITDNLADKAKVLGIPVWRFGGGP